jgi:drug/metabolite transporter (DMT)-like permease
LGYLKYPVLTFLVLCCLVFFFAFSTFVAIRVIRYALSFSNAYFYAVLTVSVLPALILRVYLSKRYGETKALPPLVAIVLFFAVNYYYAFNWEILGLETAATLSQFSLVITLSTLTIILLVYYVFYRRKSRKVEDYVAEVAK